MRRKKKSRSHLLTWFALAVALAGAANCVRAILLWQQREVLQAIGAEVPGVTVVSSAALGVMLLAAAVGLWRRWRWGWWLALAGIPLYLIGALANQALFVQSELVQLRTWVLVGTALLGEALSLVVLLRPKTRRGFGSKT